MTSTLREVMRDAADGGAPTAVRTPDATYAVASWRSGRRRHQRGLWLRSVVVAAVLVVVASLLLPGLSAGDLRPATGHGSGAEPGGGIRSYPQRLGHQLLLTDLSATSGPIAGLIQVTGDSSSEWQAIGPTGTRFRLPGAVGDMGTVAAISADGSRIAYAQTQFGRYLVRDLRTGNVWFNQLGRGESMPAQMPSWFSPDGQRIAMAGNGGPVILDTRTGIERRPPGLSFAFGWLDADRLLGQYTGSGYAQNVVRLVVWDARTGLTAPSATISLPTDEAPNGQWAGQVRSDGVFVLRYQTQSTTGAHEVPAGQEYLSQDQVRAFTLDGDKATPVPLPDRPATLTPTEVKAVDDVYLRSSGTCPLAFQPGGEVVTSVPLAARDGGDRAEPGVPAPTGVQRLVAVQVPSACVVWAADAIAGTPRWTAFTTSDTWLAWWWREVALGGVLLGAFALWRRSRRP